MRNNFRAFWRLLLFAFGSLFYIGRILILSFFFGQDMDRNLRLRRQWFSIITKLVGVRVEVFGKLPETPGLLVCNHRSYFDPLLMMSRLLAFPVGKTEMQSWPIIGVGARISGVVFVDRKSAEGRNKARAEILDKLRQGYFVINFPEGTTHTEAQTRSFKPGMFRDAAMENFTIYPVALEYQDDSYAFIGDDTFLPHFFKCFGRKITPVRISYGQPLQSDDPEFLQKQSQTWIDQELLRLRADWHLSEQKKAEV